MRGKGCPSFLGHGCRMNLRDKAKSLYYDRLTFDVKSKGEAVDVIESFAREIRNEALEEIKQSLLNIMSKAEEIEQKLPQVPDNPSRLGESINAAFRIRLFARDTLALAASVTEDKK
ncbi:MAG TPA: hypothetical protein VKI62_02650 [Bacteroidota bacterium]|nr:hypothetical protein [Bacteroidota bacterium]